MTCYHPLTAFQLADGAVVFRERAGAGSVRSLFLPCGQCIGCKLERSAQWATRIVHEASLHERSCFLTLTYDDEHLKSWSLEYSHFQKFMRRFRKRVKVPLRFYMCGEYGETNSRPHFHACVFGFDFDDKYLFRRSSTGNLYRSPLLEELWSFGYATVGEVSFESASYVAGYVTKKLTGDGEDHYYKVFDPSTGEIWPRRKEFGHMSLRPGIGADWFRLYWQDVKNGKVVVRGHERPAPRFYLKRLSKLDCFAAIELERETRARAGAPDNSPERLLVKEQVARAKLGLRKREVS